MAQSNVGRQRVVDCWSSNREHALSELCTDAQDGQQWSIDRAHWSGRRRDGQHVVQVWRRGRRQHLVDQHRDASPAASATTTAAALRYATIALSNGAGEVVLRLLQLNDGRCWCAVQQGIAVVKSGCHDTARHCLHHVIGQQTAYVT